MNKHKAKQFVHRRASELRSLARILHSRDLIRDPGPLNHAAGICTLQPGGSQHLWSYDFQELSFQTITVARDGMRHARPRSLCEIDIYLHVAVTGICVDEDDLDDPLCNLVVDVEMFGATDAGDILTTAWHLDRHIYNTEQETGEELEVSVSHFAHPHYHVQYGGRKVWEKEDLEFGTHMLLEPPRIAHPPLDAILAVDFILSNYFGRGWRLLREDPVYRELVAGAQHRLWRPYAAATAEHWKQSGSSNWDPLLIWPQLFPFGIQN